MSKVLRLTFLLPLMLVVYVGGFIWVFSPTTATVTGHVILAVCAAIDVGLTSLSFRRYDTAHRDPSGYRKVFRASVVTGGLFGLLAIYHVVAIVLGFEDPFLVFVPELLVVALFLGAGLAWFNDDKGRR